MLSSLKMLFSVMITLLICGTVFTTLSSYVFNNSKVKPAPLPLPLPPAPKIQPPPKRCKGCRESPIEKVMARYSQTWKNQQENSTMFRTLLRNVCQGFNKAIMTQENTPVGAQIVYDGAKGNISVTSDSFNTLAKKNPFSNKPWDTCSVVGNGGILSNSTCGEMIDSAEFVIRCNLPPVENSFLKDVGNKTGLVTANPSILNQKFSGLLDRRLPFIESMSHYKDALMLLPAFTLFKNIQPSLRVVYTVEEFESPIRPVFFNPEYIRNLHSFWRSKGLKMRLSSGFMVASLALELCTNVHLYGFWPFDQHPLLHQPLNNHYYDNVQSKKKVHAMPAEFDHLLRLHEQGVLKIHLGECRPSSR